MRKPRVLTTIPGRAEKFWGMNTELADRRCAAIMYGCMGSLRKHLTALAVAVKMLFLRRSFDVAVVDGGPAGQWFTWLQSLLPFGRIPTVMVDCLWYVHASPFVQAVKRLHKRLSARSTDSFVVWARHEIEDYAREFGISEEKFHYQPFHITLEDYDFEARDEEFVFAGGNGDRDYKTLVDAVRGLGIPVFIASTNENLLRAVNIPPNVTVRGVSHERFRELMASCRVAVVPMAPGLLHSGGQQTFLNAMYMGKPTVVVGPRAAEGYIEDGRTGLVVDYGDVRGLRDALERLWNDGALRSEIGEAGKRAAESLTTARCMQDIYAHALEVWQSRGVIRAEAGEEA